MSGALPPLRQPRVNPLARVGTSCGEVAKLHILAASKLHAVSPVVVLPLDQLLEGPTWNDKAATESQAGELVPSDERVGKGPGDTEDLGGFLDGDREAVRSILNEFQDLRRLVGQCRPPCCFD